MPKPVDLVGNAWGGHVGLTLAAHASDWCRSVAPILAQADDIAKIIKALWRDPQGYVGR
ncbi:hypothetical protein [Mycobacterium hubeiense]|uniref:hypothetical protein n=1 Tax=Mycobacterium hubeiense TaxID=1867256 RepID=UPI001304684C|nr:hypothetical protein [Mycobacterium sp. QGD 101]